MPNISINDKNFTYISYLGKGNFGKTYLYESDRVKYVFKFFYPTKKAESAFNKELEALQKTKKLLTECKTYIICYEYILQVVPDDKIYEAIYYNLSLDKKLNNELPVYCIITDYIDGNNLKYVEENHGVFNIKQWGTFLRAFITKSLQIINLLHSLDIIHRDIKLENIILTEDNDDNYNFSLIDLGGTCIKNCVSTYGSIGYFSLNFLAMNRDDITIDNYKLQDIYCIYICLYILANHRHPFITENKFINKDDDINYYINSDSSYDDINKILNEFFNTYIRSDIKNLYVVLNSDNLLLDAQKIISNLQRKSLNIGQKFISFFRK